MDDKELDDFMDYLSNLEEEEAAQTVGVVFSSFMMAFALDNKLDENRTNSLINAICQDVKDTIKFNKSRILKAYKLERLYRQS